MDIPVMVEYIVSQNPQGSIDFCEQMGYSVDATDTNHIYNTMCSVIDDNPNDNTLKALAAIHPDKSFIIDASKNSKLNACGSCQNYSPCSREKRMITNYAAPPILPAIGNSNSGNMHSIISNQTNTLLLIGILAIGIAIIYKK